MDSHDGGRRLLVRQVLPENCIFSKSGGDLRRMLVIRRMLIIRTRRRGRVTLGRHLRRWKINLAPALAGALP